MPIQKQGHTLVRETGETVEIGDKITDFRGVTDTLKSAEFYGGSSTGRVYSKKKPHGVYPSVFGLKWRADA